MLLCLQVEKKNSDTRIQKRGTYIDHKDKELKKNNIKRHFLIKLIIN
jgi:hypothetical protein